MAKFKITWIADVPKPVPLCILGAGIKFIKMPREFSEIVDAEYLERALEILRYAEARCVQFQSITGDEANRG